MVSLSHITSDTLTTARVNPHTNYPTLNRWVIDNASSNKIFVLNGYSLNKTRENDNTQSNVTKAQ